MICQLATYDDLSAILEINSAVVKSLNKEGNFQWDDSYPTASDFRQDIDDGNLWVALIDGDVIGYAALTTDQPDDYKNVGWDISQVSIVPHRLAVLSSYRGRGVAQTLMKRAEDLARERGLKEVRVDTSSINDPMNNLFKKMGYQFVGSTGIVGKPVDLVYCYNKVV